MEVIQKIKQSSFILKTLLLQTSTPTCTQPFEIEIHANTFTCMGVGRNHWRNLLYSRIWLIV